MFCGVDECSDDIDVDDDNGDDNDDVERIVYSQSNYFDMRASKTLA